MFALHFEPTGRATTHFINVDGKPLVEPDYVLEASPSQEDRIKAWLTSFPSELSYVWMCAPVYRDVLIWKELTGRIVRSLQLCFECDHYILSDSPKSSILLKDGEGDLYAESIKRLKAEFAEFDRQTGYTRGNPLRSV